jgi:hypothetical protein
VLRNPRVTSVSIEAVHRSDLPLRRCPLTWSDLRPEGRDRWCDHCGQTVLDLSSRTEREARRWRSSCRA